MSAAILISEDTAVLQRAGKIRIQAGWKEVSRLELQELGNESSTGILDSSGSATSSPASASSTASQESGFIRLPTNLHSVQTFEHLGFTPQTAMRLMATWDRLPAHEKNAENALWRIATAHIRAVDVDAGGLNEDWCRVMTKMGLNTETQARIMDPEYQWVRLTETCVFWGFQGVKDRFDALAFIQAESRARSRAQRSMHGEEMEF